MTELVLHHYEVSPFSEKMRRMLAFKGLPYRAVRAPAVMPKPDLIALTGGYRKIPVLQRGNHVYCDTALMAVVLEQAAPAPSFFPTPLAQSFAEWADSALFEVAVAVGFRPTRVDDMVKSLTQEELAAFAPDRKAIGEDARRKGPPGKLARSHLNVYLARIEAAVARAPFVLGEVPSIADFAVYHACWFLRSMTPEVLQSLPAITRWMERIAAFQGPAPIAMSAIEAIELCRASSPEWEPESFADPVGFSRGQRVTVRALDYGREPVEGELWGSSAEELVLRRVDPRAGTVFVHFPRIGFEVAVVKPG